MKLSPPSNFTLLLVSLLVCDAHAQTSNNRDPFDNRQPFKRDENKERVEELEKRVKELERQKSQDEAAAQKAEEDRLANLPLDPDLQKLLSGHARRLSADKVLDPRTKLKLLRKYRLTLAKIQNQRNEAETE